MQLLNIFRSRFARIIVLVSAAVYSLFNVGILKSSHFCMDRLASVTLFSAEAKKCPCAMLSAEKNSCCHDDQDLIKIEDDQRVFVVYHLNIPHLYILEDLYTERLIAGITTGSKPSFMESDPSPPVPIYKSNCSFVFYDDKA